VDRWLVSQYIGATGTKAPERPETIFGVRIDSVETSRVQVVRNAAELHDSLECLDAKRNPSFETAFLELCHDLRPSKVSGHLFLLHPETLQSIDMDGLARAAQDAHVSVHALCRTADCGFRELSLRTGGFYLSGDDLPDLLAAVYRGLSNRYQAQVTMDGDAARVQIAVRSADSFGESPILEMPG